MLYAYRMLMKSQHFTFIVYKIVPFLGVLMRDSFYVIYYISHFSTQTAIVWISSALSLLIALLFLASGMLVWWQVRSRKIALPFLGCCLSMMIFFTLKTYSSMNHWMDVLYWVSGTSFIICFSTFFVFFPCAISSHHRLRVLRHTDLHPGFIRTELFMRSYLWLIGIGDVGVVLLYLGVNMHLLHLSWLLSLSRTIYLSMTLPGLCCLFLWSYSQSKGSRERSQLLLFVCGMIMTSAPFFTFSLLNRLSDFASLHGLLVEGMLCLLPLITSYALLRYQILLFDSIVSKWVSILFGIAFFALLATCVFMFAPIVPSQWIIQHRNTMLITIVFSVTALTPIIWWSAKIFTEKLFFREVELYRRLFDEPSRPYENIVEIDDVVHLITTAVLYTLQTTQVCVFVFDDSSGQYALHSNVTTCRIDTDCRTLLMSLSHGLNETESDQEAEIGYLDARLPIIQSLEQRRLPLLLSGARTTAVPGALERYFSSTSFFGDDVWLIAPIQAQGKMIGLLLLGACDEPQAYSGTDMEIVHQLTERYAMVLETARLYARVSHHTSLLNSLYDVSIMPNSAFNTVLDAVTMYAAVAARSTAAVVEMWLYNRLKNELQRAITTGDGPHLFSHDRLENIQKRDWSACFFAQGQAINEEMQATYVPSCLSQMPSHAFAWLPLHKDEQYIGVLMITYARPHVFLWEEMCVLEMFTKQCLSTLENVQMTTELRTAYERQKDLDRLKDQFIMTASHELRTPLTAVLGYIELLDQYHEQLEVTSRTEFIEKARLGYDELSLLVRNIIDASQVNNYVGTIHLHPISLRYTVSYVLEMMDATMAREQRAITVNIADSLYVFADEARLQQVLLNLVSNALKYSIEGSNISISAQAYDAGQQAIISIQDYGLGVPPDQQEQLFERFVRLDRDINSPVRGAGLGLFICRRLLEAMGGRVWIESSGVVGEGSVLAFALSLVSKKHDRETASLQIPV